MFIVYKKTVYKKKMLLYFHLYYKILKILKPLKALKTRIIKFAKTHTYLCPNIINLFKKN